MTRGRSLALAAPLWPAAALDVPWRRRSVRVAVPQLPPMTAEPVSSLPASGGDAGRSVFAADPLANWANDDILLSKPARDRLAAEHPRALRVLDWPELRVVFASYEAPASQEAGSGKRLGRLAMLAGGLGLLSAAIAPLVFRGMALAGLEAGLIVLAAAGFAVWRRQVGRRNARWLASRFWTERVRALYFQVLINNLGLAAEAMGDDKAFGAWKRMRAEALAALPLARDLAARDLARDVAGQDVWILPAWAAAPPAPPRSAELAALLERLGAQRFDGQIAYIGQKLGGDGAQPRGPEATRYAAFRAGVVQARAQFDAGGVAEKIAALRAMEGHAFRDLTGFIAEHSGGRSA